MSEAAELGQLLGQRGAEPPHLVHGQVVVTGTTVTVNIGGQTPTLRWLGGWPPANGDVVLVALQGAEAWVIGKVLTAPPSGTSGSAPLPPPPPPSGSSTGTTAFPAIDSGSFRDGVWRGDTSDVIQGDAPGYGGHPNSGAWFYGTGPSSLAGAVVLGAEIYLPGESSSVSTPTVHLYRHTASTRPAGDVARVAGPFDIAKGGEASGWYPITGGGLALVQALVDAGGGLGITGSPYARHKGLAKNGQSGALRITWQR